MDDIYRKIPSIDEVSGPITEIFSMYNAILISLFFFRSKRVPAGPSGRATTQLLIRITVGIDLQMVKIGVSPVVRLCAGH